MIYLADTEASSSHCAVSQESSFKERTYMQNCGLSFATRLGKADLFRSA